MGNEVFSALPPVCRAAQCPPRLALTHWQKKREGLGGFAKGDKLIVNDTVHKVRHESGAQ
jgi:hypothetical protein